MGIEKNFGDKINSNGLKQNPQHINRKGRPKKMYRTISEELKKKGYEQMTKSEYEELMSYIFNASENDLHEIAEDLENPYPLRLFLYGLNDKQKRWEMLKDLRDWLFGKAAQSVDITTGGEALPGTQLITELANDIKQLIGEGENKNNGS